MAEQPEYKPQTRYTKHRVAGTAIEWEQASKILPFDDMLRGAILEIEAAFNDRLEALEDQVAHLPSRVRSLLWVLSAIPVLRHAGHHTPDADEVQELLERHIPSAMATAELGA
jgi:hypothetical protein